MTQVNDTTRLTRDIQEMPADLHDALERHDLMTAYEARPAYQRNDYLAWIGRARRGKTRSKRLQQMLDELAQGGVYMRMNHSPSM